MSSIGHYFKKCKISGCNKPRPYWSDWCKMHREQYDAQAIKDRNAVNKTENAN